MRTGPNEAGIGRDTREWAKLALVDEVTIDGAGVFVDCTTQPEGYPVRAQMSTQFSGKGFGAYYPVQVGDQVLVAFPDGSLDGKAIAMTILHNDEDLVPSEAQADPASFWLVSEAGRSIRIRALGAGVVELVGEKVRCAGTALTVLGDPGDLTAPEGVVNGTAFDFFTGQTQHQLGNASTLVRAKR